MFGIGSLHATFYAADSWEDENRFRKAVQLFDDDDAEIYNDDISIKDTDGNLIYNDDDVILYDSDILVYAI